MSYPGPVGYTVNLGCETGLQRATDQFNFVVDNGGGDPAPTVPSNLQSPAAILAALDNTCTLQMTGSNGASIALEGNDQYNIISGTDSSFQIAHTGNSVTALKYEPGTNKTTIGDGVQTGEVAIGQPLQINDPTLIGGNALELKQTNPTTSLISQTVATSGILSIGSSLSNVTSLQVADLAGDATVYVRSADGQVPLEIRSNNTGSSIIPGTPNSGNITIGSSALNPSGLTITDTATTINKLGGAPQVLLATGNLAPGSVPAPTSFSFPAPTGEGLYAIVGSSSGISTANSRSAQLTSICYVGPTGVVAIGGAAFADVGSIGSDDCIEFAPINNNTFNGSYTGGQQVNNFSVLAFKLSGPIPGTF